MKDDTQNFLKSCEEQVKNLCILQNNKNQGASFSRNRGVAQANGDIVVLIDDDVSLFPDCLDELKLKTLSEGLNQDNFAIH